MNVQIIPFQKLQDMRKSWRQPEQEFLFSKFCSSEGQSFKQMLIFIFIAGCWWKYFQGGPGHFCLQAQALHRKFCAENSCMQLSFLASKGSETLYFPSISYFQILKYINLLYFSYWTVLEDMQSKEWVLATIAVDFKDNCWQSWMGHILQEQYLQWQRERLWKTYEGKNEEAAEHISIYCGVSFKIYRFYVMWSPVKNACRSNAQTFHKKYRWATNCTSNPGW